VTLSISQKDVVLIQFPFSNQEDSKARPVIVFSNDKYNKEFPDFLAIPLTSQVIIQRNHTLMITNEEMEKGELIKVSIARVDKISSLHQKLVIHKIGKIRKDTFKKLKDLLLEVI
jgi:mRNA interferase MazF